VPSDDLTPWLIDAINPIVSEYIERLDGELSDADLTAATTAIQKAAIAGVRQGTASVQATAAQRGVSIDVHWAGDADYDDWAQRYGSEA